MEARLVSFLQPLELYGARHVRSILDITNKKNDLAFTLCALYFLGWKPAVKWVRVGWRIDNCQSILFFTNTSILIAGAYFLIHMH